MIKKELDVYHRVPGNDQQKTDLANTLGMTHTVGVIPWTSSLTDRPSGCGECDCSNMRWKNTTSSLRKIELLF